jgi:hypothetical protein
MWMAFLVEHEIAMGNIISYFKWGNFSIVMVFEHVKGIYCLHITNSSMIHGKGLGVYWTIGLVRSVNAILNFNFSAVIQASRIIVDDWSFKQLVWIKLDIFARALNGVVDDWMRLYVHVFVYYNIVLVESNMHISFCSTNVNLTTCVLSICWERRYKYCNGFRMKSSVHDLVSSNHENDIKIALCDCAELFWLEV